MTLKGDVDNLKVGVAALAAETDREVLRKQEWFQWKGKVEQQLDQIIKMLNEQGSRPQERNKN